MMTFADGESGSPGNPGYVKCRNRDDYDACNWMVLAGTGAYCRSCRLNEVVPDLTDPRRVRLWYLVEQAKRRLLFTLLDLGLHFEGAQTLRFRILADDRLDHEHATMTVEDAVTTGYYRGMITLNLLEADPVMREQMRLAMGEPYRTLLGHCRHECGHYFFWQLVIGARRDGFRSLFGDETADYRASLERYYGTGPSAGWPAEHISAYAASHPLEDFAETWAHYLHMVDTLQTAAQAGTEVHGRVLSTVVQPFDAVLGDWRALTGLANGLSRSLGADDLYPFDVVPRVAEKLAFVAELVRDAQTAERSAT